MKKVWLAVSLCMMGLLALAGCEAQSESSVASETVPYENAALGIRFELPAIFQDHVEISEETEEIAGETVNVLNILYQDGEESANIYRIEEMSATLWEQMQAEEGPTGIELGQQNGRAVIYYPPQSNPFAEGSAAFDALQKLHEQITILADTFSFLN